MTHPVSEKKRQRERAPSSARSLLTWLWQFGPAGYILAAAVMVLVRTAAFALWVAPDYADQPAPENQQIRITPTGNATAKSGNEPLRFVERRQPDGTTTLTVDPDQQRFLDSQSRRIVVPSGFFVDPVASKEMRAAPRVLYLWTAAVLALLLGCAVLARRLPLTGGIGALITAFVGIVVLALFNPRSALDLWALHPPALILLLFAAGSGATNRDRPIWMMDLR